MSARYRFRLGAPALAGGLATLLLLLAGAPCAVRADEDFSTCGAVPYLPSEYACYGNATLCPVTFGVASAPCAGSCYVPGLHACVDGAVKPLPEATSPFTLVVHAVSSRLNGLDVKACGNFLAIGAGARRCVSCRGAAQGVNCGAYGNQTVLLPSGEMVSAGVAGEGGGFDSDPIMVRGLLDAYHYVPQQATDVEGGQYWYVNPDEGILQYSKVGSNGTEKSIAGQSVKSESRQSAMPRYSY